MGGGGDLWMVLRHSMNAGLVVGIPRRSGTLTPYLMQKNFLHWEMAGTQKLLAWAIAPGCGCSRQSHLVEFVLPNFPPKISLTVKFVNLTNYFKLFHFGTKWSSVINIQQLRPRFWTCWQNNVKIMIKIRTETHVMNYVRNKRLKPDVTFWYGSHFPQHTEYPFVYASLGCTAHHLACTA